MAGQRHMEYVNERGQFDDLPLDAIRASFAEVYPFWTLDAGDADFARDAQRENPR